ncbi:MAG TPA: hypothetical protein VEK07_17230 [Polyangiaceae bacterium]|nr:hypothetical protein [Polyangiaceae bacterium]
MTAEPSGPVVVAPPSLSELAEDEPGEEELPPLDVFVLVEVDVPGDPLFDDEDEQAMNWPTAKAMTASRDIRIGFS